MVDRGPGGEPGPRHPRAGLAAKPSGAQTGAPNHASFHNHYTLSVVGEKDGTHRGKKLLDEQDSKLARLPSRPYIVGMLISALIGAGIMGGVDITSWAFFEWLARDREQSDFRHDIDNALRQIERLEKSVAENRTVDLKDKESFRHALEVLKQQLERIEFRIAWLHGEGGGADRRTLQDFFEWKQKQEKKGMGWGTPENEGF